MKIRPRFAASLILLTATILPALADTNLEIQCVTRPLNLSLTAWSNGALHTNGILGSTKAESRRISAKDLTQALNGKPVYTLATAITNWITIQTNRNPNPIPDEYVTNHFQRGTLVIGPVVTASFSSHARLLLIEAIGIDNTGPIPIIRDGDTPVDFVISDYLSVRNLGFTQTGQSAVVKSAKYDMLHDLVDSTEVAVKSVVFDDKSDGQTGHMFFDVQGFASEHVASVTRTNTVLGLRAGGRMSASVSGLGRLGAANEFFVIRGAVMAGGGKLEVK